MEQITQWNETWSLAVVFGLASVPWTYAFVAGFHFPLWPSFIASATVYAAGAGLDGFIRGYASNVAGIIYATATLAIVNSYLGGGVIALSIVVGIFMFLANLHEFVLPLSFTPGGFFGYAAMFGVHASDATVFGVGGLPGETLVTVLSMFIGAAIGLVIDETSSTLSKSESQESDFN